MRIKFWGVRGSIPTPLTNEKLKSRIAAVLQRANARDLQSPETREAFLSRLPPYLFGTIGGNTTCFEFLPDDEKIIIVDAGSGIRELGVDLLKKRPTIKTINILFTHFHYDHLQGLPFFGPALNKGYRIDFYSPKKNFESVVKEHMRPPYFPVEMDVLPAAYNFHLLTERSFKIGITEIVWKRMKHPQGSFSYRFSCQGKVVIFATDSEITEKEFERTEENRAYFEEVDILILDSQYTLEESINKIDWGHTSYSMAVDLAAQWKIKTLVLFHHEPMYEDKKILGILRSARWYIKHLENCKTEVMLAVEGTELSV